MNFWQSPGHFNGYRTFPVQKSSLFAWPPRASDEPCWYWSELISVNYKLRDCQRIMQWILHGVPALRLLCLQWYQWTEHSFMLGNIRMIFSMHIMSVMHLYAGVVWFCNTTRICYADLKLMVGLSGNLEFNNRNETSFNLFDLQMKV